MRCNEMLKTGGVLVIQNNTKKFKLVVNGTNNRCQYVNRPVLVPGIFEILAR